MQITTESEQDPICTMKLKHPADLLQGVDYKLVLDFFALFSRFEHAMKCHGFKK